MDDQARDPLRAARLYASRGWWRRCRRACRVVSQADRSHPIAQALIARCDAELGVLPWEQAELRVRALAAAHPELVPLQIASAGIAYRRGRKEDALAALRALSRRYPDDAQVHQAYAGLLGCERATWPEAWEHYQAAIASSGALASSGYRAAAYAIGRTVDPTGAQAALAGAPAVERLLIETRGLRRPRLTVPVVVGLVGLMLAPYAAVPALALVGLCTAWAGWVISALVFVRMCRRCLAGWLAIVGVLWLIYPLAVTDPHGTPWAACIAGGVILSELAMRSHRRMQRRVVQANNPQLPA